MSSQSREDTGPGDRRRRRGRGTVVTGPPEHPSETSVELSQTDGDQEDTAALSRTLFSFFEPSLDAIGSFGAPIVLAGIVGLVSGIVVVAFVGSMRLYGWIDIIIGGGLILLVALISLSSVLAAFFGRTGRYGVNTAIMIAAFTGIVVVINLVSFGNNNRTDVTATNQSSLHSSTKRLLKNLEDPVRATAFYAENLDANPGQAAQDRLVRRSKVEDTFREFQVIRSSKFRFRFVDPALEPEIVRDYFGSLPTPFINETIVVENMKSAVSDDIQSSPSDPDYSQLEQALYTSILVVTGQEQKTVYFLAGHGEHDIRNPAADGYSSIQAGLESDNYDVRTLRWDTTDEPVSVPDAPVESCANDDENCQPGAALLVIAGPTEDLPEAHASALSRFLGGVKVDEKGNLVDRREAGRLIFLAEPDTPTSFLNFLSFWGVLIGQGYIRDEARSVPDLPHTLRLSRLPDVIALANPGFLRQLIEITQPQGRFLGETRLTGAAPIQIAGDPNRLSAPLAITSSDSYLIDDLGRTEPRKDSGDQSDPQGPFQTVVYVEAIGPVGAPPPSSRPANNRIANLVVFGDSDFINNVNYNVESGPDFFLNSANYLMGDYSLVSIRPKAFTFREFNLDRNERRFVRWTSILLIPGFLGMMAAFVWWVRR